MIRFASFGRRTWAFLLALLVDLVVLVGLRSIVDSGEVLLPFLFWYGIHHVGLVVEGGTLGHRLAGLRVVRTNGGRPSVGAAAARELARLGLSLPPLGLGALWMLDEPQRRTWHDLLAGTVVVRETATGAVAGPAWAAAPPWRAGSLPAAGPAPEGQLPQAGRASSNPGAG